MTQPLWQPSAERVAQANITAFTGILEARHGVSLPDFAALHAFSVNEAEKFWDAFWDYAGIIAETKGERVLADGDKMPGAQFFPDARLNFAENLLRRRDDGDAMIRRGALKYVHCATDPPQLYDLSKDPMERVNRADDPDYAADAAAFAKEIAARWDETAIRQAVIADQRRRQTVYAAMESGTRVHWDYAPPRDANNEYVRNHMDWTVAAAKTRFPPVGE